MSCLSWTWIPATSSPWRISRFQSQRREAVYRKQRRLRALTDVYEPGSTMKPFLFAAALEEEIIEPDTLIDCENGRWRIARKTIRDTHPSKWLPAHKVMRYSSNIGCAKSAWIWGPAFITIT